MCHQYAALPSVLKKCVYDHEPVAVITIRRSSRSPPRELIKTPRHERKPGGPRRVALGVENKVRTRGGHVMRNSLYLLNEAKQFRVGDTGLPAAQSDESRCAGSNAHFFTARRQIILARSTGGSSTAAGGCRRSSLLEDCLWTTCHHLLVFLDSTTRQRRGDRLMPGRVHSVGLCPHRLWGPPQLPDPLPHAARHPVTMCSRGGGLAGELVKERLTPMLAVSPVRRRGLAGGGEL
ncbi:unnamed protein product [Merluccius merluccius]